VETDRGSLGALEICRDCAAEDMGDEIVALNVDTGIYFSMRDLAVGLWRDLASGIATDDLADRVRAATGSDADFRRFIGQLVEYGLMRSAAPRPVDGEPGTAALLDGGARDIVLEIFEDMKDLILSDPIHDVDEAVGWPNPAPASAQ